MSRLFSGRLTPVTIRPATQIIFAYHPLEGSLQLATSIKQPRKGQLEQEFSRVVLGWKLEEASLGSGLVFGVAKDRSGFLRVFACCCGRFQEPANYHLVGLGNGPRKLPHDLRHPERFMHRDFEM
ncbi:hypothetical protein SH139x_001353 [Planctomycetaceae bacterium SH139]